MSGKLWTAAVLVLAICVNGLIADDKARYDNYRLYYLHLTTAEHVQIFQEIEKRSDSYSFIGHAREVGQKLNVLVAAHKVAECADILKRYNVEHNILVSMSSSSGYQLPALIFVRITDNRFPSTY